MDPDQGKDLKSRLELTFKSLESITAQERTDFIHKFIDLCSPSDLAQVNMKLEELKRDFICMLPIEIVEVILSYLDWKSLLNCCQVNSKWNRIISGDFNRLWFELCVKVLAVNEFKCEPFQCREDVNYKSIFIEILRDSKSLQSGKLFRNWSVGPTEANSLAIYKDTIATATHIVRFWRLAEIDITAVKTSFPNQFVNGEDTNFEWVNFKAFDLMSRALLMKFDDKYLVTTNYFLTVEIYCIEFQRCIQQCIGHTCQITCFDFNQDLMLIVTGSADYTLKCWSIETSEDKETNSHNCRISSESKTVWPVCIKIVQYKENVYFVLMLSTQGTLYINSVEKIEDFQCDDKGSSFLDTFNFKARLLFSGKICAELDAQFSYKDCDNLDQYLPVSHKSYINFWEKSLVAYLITDNNPRQKTKAYVKKWHLDSTNPNKLYFVRTYMINNNYEFLNEKHLALIGINRFEIIAFGLSFGLFVDDDDRIYLCNLKNRTIKCLQKELNIHNDKLRIFQLSTNVQEQFIFASRSWLDGYSLSEETSDPIYRNKSIIFSFFTQRINEVFCVLWNV